ncbi:hypothetical protein CLV98_107178 [Dyadobacter jejuensis]|uniref:Uncharacterized protein n=1 Tax=Dyadobacter jejuensis TaxID=1082580 RepID=A0A316AKT0_9BACT|nr:DUF5908 family protein [Dyadobacter jejuensis]PWJ57470.1 hypothetical protein CLV98_107178 [Dyadobacter jejuensis]
MPVQVNEVVVRAIVASPTSSTPNAVPTENCDPTVSPDGSGVDEIVEKVLEILKNKQER